MKKLLKLILLVGASVAAFFGIKKLFCKCDENDEDEWEDEEEEDEEEEETVTADEEKTE